MLQALRFVTRGAGAKVDAAIRKNISTVLLGMLGHDEVLLLPPAKVPCCTQSCSYIQNLNFLTELLSKITSWKVTNDVVTVKNWRYLTCPC